MTVRIFRMACDPGYPKPWCAFVEWEEDGKVFGFNQEGRTAEEASVKRRRE